MQFSIIATAALFFAAPLMALPYGAPASSADGSINNEGPTNWGGVANQDLDGLLDSDKVPILSGNGDGNKDSGNVLSGNNIDVLGGGIISGGEDNDNKDASVISL